MSNEVRVHFQTLLKFTAPKVGSTSLLTNHRSHNGSAAEPDFDVCSKLAADQVAESHCSLWRAERRLLADVDG